MKEIVIKISNRMYQEVKTTSLANQGSAMANALLKAVKGGIVLSKGHGRLIDEKELIEDIECEEIDGKYCDVIYVHSIYDAETIIEADKGEE